MAYQMLLIDHPTPEIAVLTLNRPDAANALGSQIALELKDFFTKLDASHRVVVINGAGKHFCAGADLKERKGMDEAAWKKHHQGLREARDAVAFCPIPVIAAVHGAAFGGGLELALACDFIYAANDAKFALTETTLGIMPGMGGTQTLPRATGTRRAKEVIFSGQAFSAQEAFDWGVANKLCSAENLLVETLACAKQIALNAPLSVKAAKQAINNGISMALDEAFACELTHYNTLLNTKDRIEGVTAFNEKRKPVFKGE